MKPLKFLYGIAGIFAGILFIITCFCTDSRHRSVTDVEYGLIFSSVFSLVLSISSFFTKKQDASVILGYIASISHGLTLALLIWVCSVSNISFSGLMISYMFCASGCAFGQMYFSLVYLAHSAVKVHHEAASAIPEAHH